MDIISHPDAIWKVDGCVVEIKTSESMNITGEAYKNHINQLLAYMAITNAPYGKIFYILMGHPELENV